MSSTRRHAVLVTIIGLYAVGFVGSLALAVSNRAAAGHDLRLDDSLLAAAFAAIPLVGALIEWHQPRNRTGRLLLWIGLGTTVAVLSSNWAEYALRAHPGRWPGGEVAAWLSAWLLVASFGAAPWLFATFPSGHISSRVGRVLARIAADRRPV